VGPRDGLDAMLKRKHIYWQLLIRRPIKTSKVKSFGTLKLTKKAVSDFNASETVM